MSRLLSPIACLPVIAALVALPTPARAQSALPGLVVRGRVVDARAQWDDSRTLFTYVSIDVTEVVAGIDVPRRLVLKQLGGHLGDLGLWIAGQATFTPADDVLLDLEVAPRDGSVHTRGLGRGAWRVSADGRATRLDGGVAADGSYSALRTALRASRRPPVSFVATPPEAPGTGDAPTFAYLPTTGGHPARWHEVDAAAPVFVDHPSTLPGGWPGGTSDVGDAIALWRGSGMDLDLRDGGATLPSGQCPATTFTGNGRIAVAYNDPCPGGIADWVVGGGYYTTADLRVVRGQTFQKFLQGFVILNDSGPHTTSAACFQDALTHGLGHALGLGHTTAGAAIMQAGPPAACPGSGSGLGSDDVQGITTIYEGIPAAIAPPDAPTAMAATAVLSTVTLAWTPASTGGAVQRFLIDAGTAPGLYNLGSLTVNAPATSTSVAGVPPGTYYVRTRAQNPLGTSAPSPEASVTVGACTPPGPPATLSAASNDTAVHLQWSPPASGVAQGYLLTAGSAPGLNNLASLPLPATPTTFAASVPYGHYVVRVQATNVCGIGAPSIEAVLDVTPCTAPPLAPSGLVAAVANGFVALQWSAPPAGPLPSGYTLRVGSVSGGSDVLVHPTGSTATTLGAPAPRGTYYVRVVATNACGSSAESNQVSVVVP